MESGLRATEDAATHPWWPPDPDTIALPIVCRPSPFLWLAVMVYGACLVAGLGLAFASPWPGERGALSLGARIGLGAGSLVLGWVFVGLRRHLRTTTIDRGGVSIRPWLGRSTTRLAWSDIDYVDVTSIEQTFGAEFGATGATRHRLSAVFGTRFRDALTALRAFVVPRLAYEVGERIEAGETVTFPIRSVFAVGNGREPTSFVKVDARAIRARYPRHAIEIRWSDVTGYIVLSESTGVVTSRKGELDIDRLLSNRLGLLALLPALTSAAGVDQNVTDAVRLGRDRKLSALRAGTRRSLLSGLALVAVFAIPSGFVTCARARRYDALARTARPSLGVVRGYRANRIFTVVYVDVEQIGATVHFSDSVLPASVAVGDNVAALVDGPPPRNAALLDSALAPKNRGRFVLRLFGPPLAALISLPLFSLVHHAIAHRRVMRGP